LPEEGSRAGFRNVVIIKHYTMGKVKKQKILSLTFFYIIYNNLMQQRVN